jgi:hypothetical protein
MCLLWVAMRLRGSGNEARHCEKRSDEAIQQTGLMASLRSRMTPLRRALRDPFWAGRERRIG